MNVRSFFLPAMVVGCISCESAPPSRSAVDVGFNPMQISGPTTSWFVPEALPADPAGRSCGGFVDLDDDGFLEVIVVGFYGFRVHTWSLDGSWAFQEYTFGSSLSDPGEDRISCDLGDADGDGDVDIVMAGGKTGWVALHGPDRTFVFVPFPRYTLGFDGSDKDAPDAAAVSFLVRPGALPDLFILRRGGVEEADFTSCQCAYQEMPGAFRCGDPDRNARSLPGVYLRNRGQGIFEVDDAAGPGNAQMGYALGVYDANGDGRQDLWIANDFGANELFLDRGDRYENVSQMWNVDHYNHGMSVVVGDIDRDGVSDLAVSEIGIPLVQFGRPGGGFENPVAQDAGFGPLAMWSWGTELEDFDNDGRLDLLVVNQNMPYEDLAFLCLDDVVRTQAQQSEVTLFRNVGFRRFLAENPLGNPGNPLFAVGSDYPGARTVASGDVNGDGVLDLLLLRYTKVENESRDKQAWVLFGKTITGNKGIRVRAPQGSVVTACVATDCQRREVGGAHGAAALHERVVHFGIGHAETADVTVAVPGGGICTQTVSAATTFVCRP